MSNDYKLDPDHQKEVDILKRAAYQWGNLALRGKLSLSGERFIVVDNVDRVLTMANDDRYELEQFGHDLEVALFMRHDSASKVVQALYPEMDVRVVDGVDYAQEQVQKIQGLIGAIEDKHAERKRAGEALSQAGGDPVQAKRILDQQEEKQFRDRILAAVVREMGLASPPKGSKLFEELEGRLMSAVNATRIDRHILFSDGLRGKLLDAYVYSEDDADAHSKEWRIEVAKFGHTGIADESDEALLERVLEMATVFNLTGSDGEWLHPFEEEFLKVMSAPERVATARTVLWSDLENENVIDNLRALSARYVAHELVDPFGPLLEEMSAQPAPTGG
ncbi:MAG: hypothetical protein EPN79_11485 [Burkholderiaceae bacterium]|nr:MAG: hypothetical protein EPN79_11485 [Burkholderiaceae bacterium]TBR76693.1 MAG: hypothetical protein EPN64_05580 [Burkholderiaceae bacterium]